MREKNKSSRVKFGSGGKVDLRYFQFILEDSARLNMYVVMIGSMSYLIVQIKMDGKFLHPISARLFLEAIFPVRKKCLLLCNRK